MVINKYIRNRSIRFLLINFVDALFGKIGKIMMKQIYCHFQDIRFYGLTLKTVWDNFAIS